MRTLAKLAAGSILGAASTLLAGPATPHQALATLPVREVTVFKDGHAFLMHAGRLPTDGNGNVVMDYLPAPVLGTFWPFAVEKGAKLTGVTAGRRKVLLESTALNLRDLLDANAGAEALVTEVGEKTPYTATVLGIPAASGEELEAAGVPGSGEKLPLKGDVVILRTEAGMKVVNLARIQDVTFKGDYRRKLAHEEFRNLLTLRLDWGSAKPAKTADVGLLYVQRGIRWIPEYKVVLEGQNRATLRLQATIINEVTDLEDVTVHLVVGVPSFMFKDSVDPMSLQQAVAQLSAHFRPENRTAQMFSNAIMSQVAMPVDPGDANPGASGTPRLDLGPDIKDAGKAEDLFVFSVPHVSLRKGERLVVPVSEVTLDYRDVYTLDIPFAPPPELRQFINNGREAEIARQMAAPKVMHKLRLQNGKDAPLTTAPALILRGNRVLAQGLMTYTAAGAQCDLELTTAVNIGVAKTDAETKRTPNAANWNGDQYGRVDLAGTITLSSHSDQAIEVAVTRQVLGNVTDADSGGKAQMVNVFEEVPGRTYDYPHWWGWYSWPHWWTHFNGIGRVTWRVTLNPGTTLKLGYTWNYYWR